MDMLKVNPTYRSGENAGRLVANIYPGMLTAEYIAAEKGKIDNLIYQYNVQNAPRPQVPTKTKYESLDSMFEHIQLYNQAQPSGRNMDPRMGPQSIGYNPLFKQVCH